MHTFCHLDIKFRSREDFLWNAFFLNQSFGLPFSPIRPGAMLKFCCHYPIDLCYQSNTLEIDMVVSEKLKMLKC